MLRYKRGAADIGKTLTWIVSTLILVLVLSAFLFFSTVLAETRIIKNLGSEGKFEGINILDEKTSFALQLSGNQDKEKIEAIVND